MDTVWNPLEGGIQENSPVSDSMFEFGSSSMDLNEDIGSDGSGTDTHPLAPLVPPSSFDWQMDWQTNLVPEQFVDIAPAPLDLGNAEHQHAMPVFESTHVPKPIAVSASDETFSLASGSVGSNEESSMRRSPPVFHPLSPRPSRHQGMFHQRNMTVTSVPEQQVFMDVSDDDPLARLVNKQRATPMPIMVEPVTSPQLEEKRPARRARRRVKKRQVSSELDSSSDEEPPVRKRKGKKRRHAQLAKSLFPPEEAEDISHLPKRDRNKISAAKYRKRRKIYVKNLESKVEELADEKEDLEQEVETLDQQNRALREQLAFFKRLYDMAGSTTRKNVPKAAGVVMFVLFSFFLLVPPSLMSSGPQDQLYRPGPDDVVGLGRQGRFLMMLEEEDDDVSSTSYSSKSDSLMCECNGQVMPFSEFAKHNDTDVSPWQDQVASELESLNAKLQSATAGLSTRITMQSSVPMAA